MSNVHESELDYYFDEAKRNYETIVGATILRCKEKLEDLAAIHKCFSSKVFRRLDKIQLEKELRSSIICSAICQQRCDYWFGRSANTNSTEWTQRRSGQFHQLSGENIPPGVFRGLRGRIRNLRALDSSTIWQIINPRRLGQIPAACHRQGQVRPGDHER